MCNCKVRLTDVEKGVGYYVFFWVVSRGRRVNHTPPPLQRVSVILKLTLCFFNSYIRLHPISRYVYFVLWVSCGFFERCPCEDTNIFLQHLPSTPPPSSSLFHSIHHTVSNLYAPPPFSPINDAYLLTHHPPCFQCSEPVPDFPFECHHSSCTNITPPEDELQQHLRKFVNKSPCPEVDFYLQTLTIQLQLLVVATRTSTSCGRVTKQSI